MSKQRRWTEEDLKSIDPHHACVKAGKARYSNVNKIEHDGIVFDSKREFLRYMDLKLLERAGEITDLKVHPKYPIIIAGISIRSYSKRYHINGRQLTYEADFKYRRVISEVTGLPCNHKVIEDVKMQSGFRTEIYKIKYGLMRAMGYDIEEY